jgi:hypothetical protein
MADPTRIFRHLDGEPLHCGDGGLISNIGFIAALLVKVGNEESRHVIRTIREDVERLQRALPDPGLPGDGDLLAGYRALRDHCRRLESMIKETVAKEQRNRMLVVTMARTLQSAGLEAPRGLSDLVLEGP